MTAITAGMLGGAVVPAFAEDITINLWSRADRSGPLRAGNIVGAADLLNKQFAAAGIDKTITIELHENNAAGFDADALDLLKAFAVDRGPDVYVAAHEWVGAFADAGYAMDLEEHIATYPEYYSDIIPILWDATLVEGARYAVPQDSEVRMFFYNKDMLREIGKSEEFIESLPGLVESGEMTIFELTDLAKEVVDGGAAQYGMVHRPNVGPDFLMAMASFGFDPFDEESGKLQASESALAAFYGWLKYAVDQGALPENMTSWSWDSVHAAFRGGESFMKFHGIWNVNDQLEAFGISTEDEYFHKLGWVHSPAAERGGRPANLSHPIVYVVNPSSEHADLAALLVAIASQGYFNTPHAVTTNHTPINFSQAAMPRFVEEGWSLRAGTPMLEYATFMPNHTRIGEFNAVIYKGIQGVETGRLSPEEGAAFVVEELESELGGDVVILD